MTTNTPVCPAELHDAAEYIWGQTVAELRETGTVVIMPHLFEYDPRRRYSGNDDRSKSASLTQIASLTPGSAETLDAMMSENDDISAAAKNAFARTVRALIRREHANAIIFASDAWAGDKNYDRPSRDPNRREALVINVELDGVGSWWGMREYMRVGQAVFIAEQMPLLEVFARRNGRFCDWFAPTPVPENN
jgi:hypothetical protein